MTNQERQYKLAISASNLIKRVIELCDELGMENVEINWLSKSFSIRINSSGEFSFFNNSTNRVHTEFSIEKFTNDVNVAFENSAISLNIKDFIEIIYLISERVAIMQYQKNEILNSLQFSSRHLAESFFQDLIIEKKSNK